MNSLLLIFRYYYLLHLQYSRAFEQATGIYEATTRENLSSGFPTKRVSKQSASKKIEVSLVASLYMTSKKQRNKVADETARVRRLICAFVVTNHRRMFFAAAVQLSF